MQQRYLAAIMFTDIVGYTSLMGSDEKKAFEILKNNRRIHWRLIKKYRGRLLKEMGDGMLASFPSNIDAVVCALSIQKAAETINIPLRIGIHQGDVIFEKKDVLGDGVNIASRIQGLAETNGIVISETVYHDIRNKKGLEIDFLGKQVLKGVQGSMGVYKVLCKDYNLLDFRIDTGELIRPLVSGKRSFIMGAVIIAILFSAGYYFLPKSSQVLSELGKSIVVLPCANYTGSDTLEYFTAGMHDALIGNLGKISSLLVKSKTSANAYKNVPVPKIATELGVHIVIEPSVLSVIDSVCLQIKMIRAYPEEKTIWVQDYCEKRSEIFNLYNRIAKEVCQEIEIVLTPQENAILETSKTVNPLAYEAYLKGMSYLDLDTKADLDRGMAYLERARRTDPDFALAYVGIARVWSASMQHHFVPISEAAPKIEFALNKAFELDSSLAEVRTALATLYFWNYWDWEKAGQEFRRAIEINPNDASGHASYAFYLSVTGHQEKGLQHVELAIKMDPLNSLYQSWYCMGLKNARWYDKALNMLLDLDAAESNYNVVLPTLWAVYHELGKYEEALEIAKRIYVLKGNDTAIESLETGNNEGGYKMAMQRTAAMMVRYNDKIFFPAWQICTLYCRAEMKNEALNWLEKAYAEHDSNMPFINVDPLFDFLREEERFKDILRKMDLPELYL